MPEEFGDQIKRRMTETSAATSGTSPKKPAPPVAGLKAAAPKPAPKATKTTSQLTSDVDRLLAGTEDTTGVPPKKK